MESIRVKMTFPETLVRRAMLAEMVRAFQVSPNIRRAAIEEHVGWIVCEVDGEIHEVERALDWLRAEGVQVDLLGDLLES
ncbi:MAG: NIL domain-containing protein [Actinobacteria bacterium]|jgi:ABC-type methionine transport system ATPase subunit|nr:NIL domain-containing protein [Actinomycetota bacterium]